METFTDPVTFDNKIYERQKAFFREYYSQLIGWQVVAVEIKEENESHFPEFWPTLTMRNATTGEYAFIEVSCDEEGNEPGFLFISYAT